jgi:hypothetical protein
MAQMLKIFFVSETVLQQVSKALQTNSDLKIFGIVDDIVTLWEEICYAQRNNEGVYTF